ncbi:MAG: hypothetical protein AMXMBFR53_03470 [Gemmatimonadota bacterium]
MRTRTLVTLLVALGVAVPHALAAQGLTLRIAPEANTFRWDDALALEDATFFGGGLSMGFGRYVLLRGAYATAGTMGTSFADAGFLADDGSELDENGVKASLISGSVLFRLGDQRVAPVLATRGGLLDLTPDGGTRTRQILAAFGGGMDLRLTPWLDGQVLVERFSMRLDRGLLTAEGAGPATDTARSTVRNSLAVGATFGIRLGAARGSDRADVVDQGFGRLISGNAEGLLVPLEIQAGVVRFDDALGLADESTVGIRTGVDLGPYFGIRGQYWRGVADGFEGWEGISGWSGEVQFNVGRVTGVSPHLILGAGQTRFADDFAPPEGVVPENQNHLVVGAGLGLPVGDRARLVVSLRDYISTTGSLDEAASPSDLRHSFGLTGGLSVLLFGRRAAPTLPAPGPVLPGDSADYRSGQVLAIPLPREGELYVRYGPGGRTLPGEGAAPAAGADSAAVAAAVSAELTRLFGAGAATLSDSARAALEAGVRARLAALGDSTSGAPSAIDSAGRPTAPSGDPRIDELRRQVDDLRRLVRESMVLQAAGGVLGPSGTTVTVVAGEGGAGGGVPESEPFLRAVEGRLGLGNMGTGNGGPTLRGEAYLSSLGGNGRYLPFAILELGRNGITTEADGRAVKGSTRTVGLGFGATMALPHLGPVWPNVGMLFSAARVGTSGDSPAEADVIDDRYGGLSLGPGFQLGVAIRPQPGKRSFLTGAYRRIWSGGTSRWSLEAGVRLVFPPRSGRPSGPFSVHPTTPAPDTTAPPPPPDTASAFRPDPDSLSARLAALEERLEAERSARARAEADAREARARADSLEASARARVEAAQAAEADLRAWADTLRAAALASPFVVAVEERDSALAMTLGGDLFPVGATDVGDEASREIRRLGAILAERPGVTLVVEGHTDSTGAEESNRTISRLRAEGVAAVLRGAGVPASAMTTAGRGETDPVADNGTADGRARNRRVELLVRIPGR